MPRWHLWWPHETSPVFSGFARQDTKADRAVLTLSEWLIETRQFAPSKVKFFLKRGPIGSETRWIEKNVKWIIFWTADIDMKVNMILAVEWTIYAVEKEPEKKKKLETWPGIATWSTQRSIHWANQSNWRAGHCEFVNYPMVEIAWMEIQSNPSTTATLHWGEKKVAVVERWLLWGGRGVTGQFF